MSDSPRRVCLLTGAAGRLGRCLLERHRQRYSFAAVVNTGVVEASLADDLLVIRSDLTRTGEVERVVDLTLARYERVDLVVHSAVYSVWGPLLSARGVLDSLPRQLAVNVVAPLQLTVEVAERCWRDDLVSNRVRRRNVVAVSSLAGHRLYPGVGRSVYAGTKAALTVIAANLTEELAPLGVRINTIAPNSFPHRVTTESVADAVVTLDESEETGRIVEIDSDGVRWTSLPPG